MKTVVGKESMGLHVDHEGQGMSVRAENNGLRVNPETTGFNSNVLNPANPIVDETVYWVWGDGVLVEWGDGEVAEQ